MKLIRLGITINRNGLTEQSRELEAIPKPTTYWIEGNKRIRKDRLLVPDSMFRNTIGETTPFLGFDLYCLPEDKRQGQELLRMTLREKINAIEKNLNFIKKSLQV